MKVNFLNQIVAGGGSKVLSALAGFALVSVSIRFLGAEQYGLWISLYTFIGWFSMLDFGIGGGLRNRLSESLSSGNEIDALEYVSTSYLSLGFILLILIFIIAPLMFYIDWVGVFNLHSASDKQYMISLIYLSVFTFILTLFLRLSVNISFSYQKSQHSSYIFFSQQLVTLVIVSLYSRFGGHDFDSLLIYGVIVNATNVLVLVLFNYYIFSILAPELKPKISHFRSAKLRSVIELGGKIFVIQICAVCLYSTDIFFINKYVGANFSAEYAILQKYFGIALFASGIILAPVWSAVAVMKDSDDRNYLSVLILKTSQAIFLVIMSISLLVVCFPFLSPVWVGDEISFASSNIYLMAFYTSVVVYLQLLSSVINGFGAVFVQLILAAFAAVGNVIATVWVLKFMGGGIQEALLISIMFNIPSVIIFSIQVNKLINRRAVGIWGS